MRRLRVWMLLLIACFGPNLWSAESDFDAQRLQLKRGVVGVIGIEAGDVDPILNLCRDSELILFVQTIDSQLADELKHKADKAELLGRRLFVHTSESTDLRLGDDVADRIIVANSNSSQNSSAEQWMRALRPRGVLLFGSKQKTKPVPEGIDDWTHPYHGPDNNPQSEDQLVRGNFRTQFIGFPKFSPMPEQTVVAGGRIYKAMGHIAHKANQNEMLNTLLCINAYNGLILWRRDLSPGFMLHRNTMIATDDGLYMGDHESCKYIDGDSGKLIKEITIDPDITDGPVWKWMAMRDGVLYALVGNPEVKIETQRAVRRGLGHWPWGMWDGHDYNDPRTSFGFGRTLVALDMKSSEPIWNFRDEEFLDARAVCMNDTQIFCYCPGKFLAAIDRYTGKLLWKNRDQDLLDAIDEQEKAQHYITGYATTCYMKCDDQYLFFAGPQRSRMVVASAKDGKLAWTHPTGNLQLVLRDDGIWAAGPQKSENGMKLDYATGEVLETFPARRACTRATGCADSIFYRASGGTVRVLTDTNTAQHIDPMRPPCQDGVIVAGGHLYWGPWMCGCQLSLYGNIALKPMESIVSSQSMDPARRTGDLTVPVLTIDADPGDWNVYRNGNARDDVTTVTIPDNVSVAWTTTAANGVLPTAPVTAGGMVFVADRSGAVRAFDRDGNPAWTAYTDGPIFYPPAIEHDRVYVGSSDGRVYALAAKDGRFLWSHRIGPADYWVPIYDRLHSAWPVSGGIVVQDGTVYAAAGIAHYDGTHVVALDAFTGELKASNRDSGTLEQEVNNGISVQGNLTIVDGELRFLAGGVYETARYDLQTLRCLNQPRVQVNSQFRTAFYPYYPDYGKYVSLDYQCEDGCSLIHDASYEGSQFKNLARHSALPEGAPQPTREAANWERRRGKLPGTLWTDSENRRFTGFAVTDHTLLAAGHPDMQSEHSFLVAMNTNDGTDRWIAPLPANAVKGGIALDHRGRIFLTLEDGTLLCLDPKKTEESTESAR